MLLETHSFEFGEFRLEAKEKVLLRDGKPVSITPKAFQLLLALVENHGRLVQKEELMQAVWADSFVEDGNLTFTIRVLRKALGDDTQKPRFIETVPRRGYRFIAEVKKTNPNNEAQREAQPIAAAVSQPPRRDRSKLYQAFLLSFFVIGLSLVTGLIVWRGKATSESVLPRIQLETLTNTGNARHATISGDGKKIAYINRVDQQESLWLLSLENNHNLEIVPRADEVYRSLRFAQTKGDIYFVRGRKGEISSLYRISDLGGAAQRVVSDVDEFFALSPAGDKIAYVRNSTGRQQSELLISNADGSGEKVLQIRQYPEKFDALAWSPGGEKVVCAIGETDSGGKGVSVSAINAVDGVVQEISIGKWFQVKSLAWLAKENSLLLAGRKKLSEQNQLWKFSFREGKVVQLTNDLNYYSEISLSADETKMLAVQSTNNFYLWMTSTDAPSGGRQLAKSYRGVSWTPDGKIVYVSNTSDNDNIWIMNADGTDQKQLTTDKATDFLPRVSRDGRFIVFVSDRSGINHIWRMNADGSEQIQITDGDGELCPVISPDDKWIFYHTSKDNFLYKVPFEGGAANKLIAERGMRPDISPDGRWLAAFRPSEKKDADSKIMVIDLAENKIAKEFAIAGGNFSSWRLRWTTDGKGLTYASFGENATTNLWQQSFDGSNPPHQLTTFSALQIFDFDFSADGKHLAIIRGSWNQDAVLISGFKQ